MKTPDNGLVLLEGAEEFRASASLCTALMDWQWTDGPDQSERRRVTWFARSSNAELTRQAADGILPIRFFDTCDHVRETSFPWPPSLEKWCTQHRARFVRLGLVVLRAFLCAGKPAQERTAWPRFLGWSELVGGALVWAGFEDPLVARRSLAAAIGDEEAEGLRVLVRSLGHLCPALVGLTTRHSSTAACTMRGGVP